MPNRGVKKLASNPGSLRMSILIEFSLLMKKWSSSKITHECMSQFRCVEPEQQVNRHYIQRISQYSSVTNPTLFWQRNPKPIYRHMHPIVCSHVGILRKRYKTSYSTSWTHLAQNLMPREHLLLTILPAMIVLPGCPNFQRRPASRLRLGFHSLHLLVTVHTLGEILSISFWN